MRVLRYEVPVDDKWHTLDIGGSPLYVAARNPSVVEFWALDGTTQSMEYDSLRNFRVFGTGHQIDNLDHLIYRGTAITAHNMLVWHLFERP